MVEVVLSLAMLCFGLSVFFIVLEDAKNGDYTGIKAILFVVLVVSAGLAYSYFTCGKFLTCIGVK